MSISSSTSSSPSAVEEVDVAAKRRVEGSAAGGRRECEHGEARLLLRRERGLLQARERLGLVGARLEHRDVRRHREQVLREAVVDLPRDARALLGDRAAELGDADRPPDADDQHDVGEQPQEVALRDERRSGERRELEVERSEQHQRRAEREPAVEVLAARAEAVAESEHGDEVRRARAGRAFAVRRTGPAGCLRRGEVGQADAERARGAPDQAEQHDEPDQQVDERGSPVLDAPANERRTGDQRPAEELAGEAGPGLGAVSAAGRSPRADREGDPARPRSTKNPPQRRRSKRRPSAAKRLADSSATSAPPTA